MYYYFFIFMFQYERFSVKLSEGLEKEPESSKLKVQLAKLSNFHTFAFTDIMPVSHLYFNPAYFM